MSLKPMEAESLKWPFVVLSLLIALTTGWAVYDEVFTRRPWKDYQQQFFRLEQDKLSQQLADEQKKLDEPATRQKLASLRQQLARATAAISGSPTERAAYQAALEALEEARLREDSTQLALRFAKSQNNAAYYVYRQDELRGDAAAMKMDGARLALAKRNQTSAQAAEDAAQAAVDAAQARVNAILKRRADLQKAISAIVKPAADLQAKIKKVRSQWTEMTQIWIPNLKNIEKGPTVDRCENCHLAVDTCGYSRPAEVLAAVNGGLSNAAAARKFCLDEETVGRYQQAAAAVCAPPADVSQGFYLPGQTPAPTPSADCAEDPAQMTQCVPLARLDGWKKLAVDYCGSAALLLPHYVVRGNQVCVDPATYTSWTQVEQHDPYGVPLVFQSHPHRAELLDKDHPVGKFGCTICHGGEGVETKGVNHHPFDHGYDDPYWEQPLLDTATVMDDGLGNLGVDLDRRWQVAQRPTGGAFAQSQCERCHQQDFNLKFAPTLSRGKELVAEVGCYGCHPIDGFNDLPKPGPPLLSLQTKTSLGWLATWIAYPKGWRPRTRMPNFWPGAVSAAYAPPSATLSDPQLLAHQKAVRAEEVQAIVAYLWSSSQGTLPPAPPGDAARGQQLVATVGCEGCHALKQGDTSRPAPGSPSRDFAPNLWNVGDKASRDWLFAWVRNPKALWPGTRMPDLRLTEQQAADVATYLSTLTSGRQYLDPAPLRHVDDPQFQQLAAKGKELIAKYGCFGCHDIRGFENAQKIGADISDFGAKRLDMMDFGNIAYFNDDPRNTETWFNWLHTKLRTPRRFGYEKVATIMPQFDFSESEVRSIMVFLKGNMGKEVQPTGAYQADRDPRSRAIRKGERLVARYGCRNCHVIDRQGGLIRDQFAANITLAPPLLNGEGAKVQPDWLFHFLAHPKQIRPFMQVRMPTFDFTDAEDAALVHYFAAQDDRSWPYEQVSSPAMDAAEAQQALQMFGMNEMKCQSCHVVGSALPASSDRNTWAPDLMEAKRRLRPDWIPVWLAAPGDIDPNTRMPAFFPAGTTPYKEFGGDAGKQIRALRDLLMHLGEPGVVPAAARQSAQSGSAG